MKSICVVGLGYIGLPTASLLANNGFKVVGVDVNRKVVDAVNSGNVHIEEPGLRTLVEAAVHSKNLRASSVPEPSDVFIICVPTPFKEGKKPDLKYVFDATDAILPYLKNGNVVILESTVPPKTTEAIAQYVKEKRKDVLDGTTVINFAHCPERVLPGRILKELVENDRVIGGLTEQASILAKEIYSAVVSGNIYTTDATTAEMVKLSENTFRDVNIALANEFAHICEKLGISVWEVISLANKHPRVNILNPGPGVGGHCIAVDPWFIASEFPKEAKIITSAREVNDSIPHRVVGKIIELNSHIQNPIIVCLGASYKANVGDERNSPALEIYGLLKNHFNDKAEIRLNDTHVHNNSLNNVSLESIFNDASLIVLLTDHTGYFSIEPEKISQVVKDKIVFDTRNYLNHKLWKSSGFEVHVIGSDSRNE